MERKRKEKKKKSGIYSFLEKKKKKKTKHCSSKKSDNFCYHTNFLFSSQIIITIIPTDRELNKEFKNI